MEVPGAFFAFTPQEAYSYGNPYGLIEVLATKTHHQMADSFAVCKYLPKSIGGNAAPLPGTIHPELRNEFDHLVTDMLAAGTTQEKLYFDSKNIDLR